MLHRVPGVRRGDYTACRHRSTLESRSGILAHMRDLYRNEYMAATLDETLLTIAWSREEPSDDNAVETVHQLTRALDDHLRNEPDTRVDVLIDLVVVRRNFPKAISAFSSWMLGKRHHVRAGAFATKSLLLRAALSAASMMPGLTAKGFGDAESARKFLREFKG